MHVLAMLSNPALHPELGGTDVTEAENYEALLSVGAVMEGNAGGDVEAWRKEVDNFNNKKPKIELDDD